MPRFVMARSHVDLWLTPFTHMPYILLILSLLFYCLPAYASIDYELRESRKCSSMFPYFEKKHRLPVHSLHSISLQETAKKHSKHDIAIVWPWTVMNNKDGSGHHFKTQFEALNYVRAQFKAGNNNLDVGCMQINLKHNPEAFSSLEEAFAPSRNIAYGAYFLSENVKKTGSIEKAIGRYHSTTEHLAVKYLSGVSKIKMSMNEYINNLRKYSTASVPAERHGFSYAPLYRKATPAPKVQVRVGKIKNSDWFRKKTAQR